MSSDAWTWDELGHAGEEHLDAAYVASYDRKAGTDPADDLALLRRHGMNPTDTLVDLGAGTGAFALAAAPFCQRVVAVDVSPAMLAVLQAKIERVGIPNIECVRAGFLSYQHTGDPAAVVYSRHALHHLPDFWKAVALQRIASILRPGGVLLVRDLVFSFEPQRAQAALAAWLTSAAASPAEGWTRDELQTHLRQEYSTFTWLLEPMLTHAGFAIREAEYSASAIYAGYVCAKHATASADQAG
jgi:ubiquinone/menaquinone biosynthesis C-methylase UbiE